MHTNGTLKPNFVSQLAEQVSNPQHVYILTKNRARWEPIRHAKGIESHPWDGSAIRFTSLAAERVASQLKKQGAEVRLEEAI